MMNLLRIDEIAKKLEKWANNLTYSPPSPTMIRLLPDVGQDKVILWLLAEMPAVGRKVEKDFEILYQIHNDVYGWRGKAIAEDEWPEFMAQVETVKGVAYELVDTLRQITQKARQELSLEQPAETGRNRKATIDAIIISLSVICILLLSVWLIPFTPFTWLKNHPNSYPLQGSIICLIPCVVVGFLKPQWRKWCWGSAVAFVVLILSLA